MNNSATQATPTADSKIMKIVKNLKGTQKRTVELLTGLQTVANKVDRYDPLPAAMDKPQEPNSLVSALEILELDADRINDWLQSLIVHLDDSI